MKCNCVNEIETKIHTHFEDTDKEHTGEFTSEMKGKCFLFDGSGMALSLPINVEYKKLTKSGNLKRKIKNSICYSNIAHFVAKK